MPTAEGRGPAAARRWAIAVGALGLLCAANVALFTWFAAIPLPAADAWYFLSVFVSKALGGGIGLADLFVQRGGGVDHAQPLQKLVLLGHLYAADLDFRLEAMVGVAAAVATCGLLAHDLLRAPAEPSRRARAALGAMAVLLVGLSLNAIELYTWSLVTLGWMMLLVAVLYWRGLATTPEGPVRGFLTGAGATLAAGLVLDDLAIPVVIALLAARTLGDPQGARRIPALALAAGVMGGLLAARLLIAWLSPVDSPAGPSLASVVAAVDGWRDLLLLLGGPLANALLHASHSPRGAEWLPWIVLGAVSALAHVAFWWRVLVSRRLPSPRLRVLAIAMMLMFYATVAGILLSRAPIFGVEYVHQPRYVLFYQLGVLAWVLLFAAPPAAAAGSQRSGGGPWATRFAVVATAALLALQGWLSAWAWDFLPYQRAYLVEAAAALAKVAEQNQVPAHGCPPILTVCQLAPRARAELIALLQTQQLNLFSASFRDRHGLAAIAVPEAVIPRLVPGEACMQAIIDWGPKAIQPGKPFNIQPNGQSAYWITMDPGATVVQVSVGGNAVKFAAAAGVVSFLHQPAMQARVVRGRDVELRLDCADGTEGLVTIPVRQP